MQYGKFSDQVGFMVVRQIALILLFIVFGPMIAIWCINTLFATSLVAEAFGLHWFAMLVLLILIRGRK